jgi:glyoxylase-like metal-dependent hydrolase (beta-lactamase superfamily II)
MKKTTKRILLGAAIVVVLLVAFVGIEFLRLKGELDQFKTAETGRITDRVSAIDDSMVNLYVVKGATRFIAFDAGNGPEGVRKGLETLGINPADVAAVFLTHADPDHTGGLSVFEKADVYLPSEEAQMIDGRTARFFVFIKNELRRKHVPINDGQTVEIDGLKVTAILTPGHTPGSTSYVVDGQYLFAGDNLSLKSGKAGVFSEMINMDSNVQRESLKKLAKLEGIRYVFTAHHGYTDSFEKAFEDLRK